MRPIAGYGHIAVGMASGRLFADLSDQRRPWRQALIGIGLAWLPDVDVLWLALGAPDRGLLGHRGFTHTPLFALAVGALVGVWLWARGRGRPVTLAVLAALLVGTHGILDGIAQDGRGILFFWPLSAERFHLPWRPIPDAPLGLALFSRVGLSHLALEFLYFIPFTLFTLRWRREKTRRGRPAAVRSGGWGLPEAVGE
ncbi:MAG TPA: metal-dependent hydrolase [Polyangia bacterium]|nr:metal-dependent hydrolase [Polyangia bacterium]